MKKVSVKVTASVTKIIEVQVDETSLKLGEDIEDLAIELANDEFTFMNDGTEEKYSQDAEIIEIN